VRSTVTLVESVSCKQLASGEFTWDIPIVPSSANYVLVIRDITSNATWVQQQQISAPFEIRGACGGNLGGEDGMERVIIDLLHGFDHGWTHKEWQLLNMQASVVHVRDATVNVGPNSARAKPATASAALASLAPHHP
jgi:hypothetical protein